MEVTKLFDDWPESTFRKRKWIQIKKARKCYTIGKWEKSCFNSSQRKIEFLCPVVSLALKESMRLNSLDFEKKAPIFSPTQIHRHYPFLTFDICIGKHASGVGEDG